MIISRKKYEEDLQKARREEAERYAAYEDRKSFEERQRELERSLHGKLEALRRESREQKEEIYKALGAVERRVRDAEISAAKKELSAVGCTYVGKHERKPMYRIETIHPL